MKHRITALIFGLVGLGLVVLWMQPKPIEHVGNLHRLRLVGLAVRDASGEWYQTSDTVFIHELAAAMDETSSISRVEPRMSRGFFECRFARAADLPIKVRVLCHIDHGPVLQENRSYSGMGMVNVIQLLAERFPKGKWCPVEAPAVRR